MDSSNPDSAPPSLEELTTRSAAALLLPLIVRMWGSGPLEIGIFVDQTTRSIVVMEDSLDIESIIEEIVSKEGPRPASKASIESLLRVRVSDPGHECPICLAEYEVNGEDEEEEVKEMPCRHRFHSGCIGKWLGIHGSCPVCRFSMPVEKEEESQERWKVHLIFAQRVTDSDTDPGMDVESDRDDDPDSGSGHDVAFGDESPAQGMEIDNID